MRITEREEDHLGADNVFVWVDVVQCVVVVLFDGAQWLLPASSNAVQRLLWWGEREEGSMRLINKEKIFSTKRKERLIN